MATKDKPDADALMTPQQVSEYLAVPMGTLEQWRSQRRGPPFFKLDSSKLVRYNKRDLDEWLLRGRISTRTLNGGV
jgi:hypothetical protein